MKVNSEILVRLSERYGCEATLSARVIGRVLTWTVRVSESEFHGADPAEALYRALVAMDNGFIR